MASATEYVVKANESYPLSTRFAMKGKTRHNIKENDINWINGVNLIDPDSGLTPLMIAASQGGKIKNSINFSEFNTFFIVQANFQLLKY